MLARCNFRYFCVNNHVNERTEHRRRYAERQFTIGGLGEDRSNLASARAKGKVEEVKKWFIIWQAVRSLLPSVKLMWLKGEKCAGGGSVEFQGAAGRTRLLYILHPEETPRKEGGSTESLCNLAPVTRKLDPAVLLDK